MKKINKAVADKTGAEIDTITVVGGDGNVSVLPLEEKETPLKDSPQREKAWLAVGGATSFEEAEQALQTNQLSDDIIDLTFAFDTIAWNISKIPVENTTDTTSKGRMILTEAKALVDRIEGLINDAEDNLGDTNDTSDTEEASTADDDDDVPEPVEAGLDEADKGTEINLSNNKFVTGVKSVLNAVGLLKNSVKVVKEFQGFKLFKSNIDDSYYLYGRPTNNIIDLESDILTENSHKEFITFLDDNPDQAPELWTWHEEKTARKNKAHWWDYSDGFVHFFWELTNEEAKGIEKFCDEFTPGMSHGFHPLGIAPGIKVLEKEGNLILKYRMVEASILPLEFAANPHTSFSMISA